jgi:tRNA pseudouridine13 synthase
MAQLTPEISPYATDALLCPYGQPELSGEIKRVADDFRVVEQLGFEPEGHGEHLFLNLRKTGLTTPQLIEKVCAIVGIPPRQAGYSGLKDKQAVTEQWISLHMPGCRSMPDISEDDQVQVLDARWHTRKLKAGAHRANTFDIRVRDLHGASSKLPDLVDQIVRFGFANYFGDQRFGAGLDNVDQALRYLGNPRKNKRLSRTRKSLYLSAMRSFLFNRILDRRIKAGFWLAPMAGDLFMLDGSHSIFNDQLNADIQHRYRTLDVHSAISLYGVGDSRVLQDAGELEARVFADYPALTDLLRAQKINRAYRASRARAHNLQVEVAPDGNGMRVRVELARGVYLTSLLGHILRFDKNEGSGGGNFMLGRES